jgi:hypothetical protein
MGTVEMSYPGKHLTIYPSDGFCFLFTSDGFRELRRKSIFQVNSAIVDYKSSVLVSQ